MYRLIFIFLLNNIILSQKLYPPTPIEFRGLWCIARWNEYQGTYSEQLGQAFFYNNGTFTMNFLNSIGYTWINHFVEVNQTDNQGTYQVITDTSQGPSQYLNRKSCFWRRQISNGDIIWGRQSYGICTPSFETDNSFESTRYTRNGMNCYYVNDEKPSEVLSDTQFERSLLEFDKSLKDTKKQSIVFYGSSSIRLWSTLEKDFSDVQMNVINRGFGGSTLKQCWQQFKRIILPLEPRLLIVYAGENDIVEGETAISVQNVFHQFISTTRRFFPSLPIVFISVKPSPARYHKTNEMNLVNQLIKQDIQYMTNVDYIDVFTKLFTANGTLRSDLFISDNIHMNEQGYDIWTQAVRNYLRTNGFISRGLINSQLSIILFIFNLFVFYKNIN